MVLFAAGDWAFTQVARQSLKNAEAVPSCCTELISLSVSISDRNMKRIITHFHSLVVNGLLFPVFTVHGLSYEF